jgi:hypothetical protein
MSDRGPGLIDTSDMLAVHQALERALTDISGQIDSADEGDVERAGEVVGYLHEVLWLLEAHHQGEDELLYPKLVDRAGEHVALYERMDAQHRAVSAGILPVRAAGQAFAVSASSSDAAATKQACEELRATLLDHTTVEETEILPIAARCVTPPEWGELPGHAMATYRGERIWLPFGLVVEAMSDEQRDALFAHAPPPVSTMWHGGGADAFSQEMTLIREGRPG